MCKRNYPDLKKKKKKRHHGTCKRNSRQKIKHAWDTL